MCADKQICYACMSNEVAIKESQPDNVGSCLSFLCQELGVMHHLLQETNYPHLQLWVQLKVLRKSHNRSIVFLLRCREMERRNRQKVKVNRTCECLDTQWRRTFKTLFVAALLITNSLSPFLWSVGKPGTRLIKIQSTRLSPPYMRKHKTLFCCFPLFSVWKSCWIKGVQRKLWKKFRCTLTCCII